MSDDEIEVFTIKDPRPLTAKLRPDTDTPFEDIFNVDEQEVDHDQSHFETENAFERNISRNVSMDTSFADFERSMSSEEKSGGEKGEKRGNNKVSSSITQSPYQKRKVRKKDSKQKKKAFNLKRVGANSSTSSINYQTHTKYDDSDNKATNSDNKATNVQTSKDRTNGTNKGTKDRTIKRRNSQLRGKNYPDQNQLFSSSSSSSCNQIQNRSQEKNAELSIVSGTGTQAPTKRNEVHIIGRCKEKRKPNYEHIAKLAEINMGCSKHKNGGSLDTLPLNDGVIKDEETMDESCELMEVCDSQERETGTHRDAVMDSQELEKTGTMHHDAVIHGNKGESNLHLHRGDAIRDNRITMSDDKTVVRNQDDSSTFKNNENTVTTLEERNLEGRNLEERNLEERNLEGRNLEERNLEERNLEERNLEGSTIERDRTRIHPEPRHRVKLTNFSLSMPNTRDGRRSEDEEDAHSTWLLDCRNIWSSNKLKGHYQKMYQGSETRERGYQNARSQVEFNTKPVNKANNRFMQSMKNSAPSRGGCIMRTVKQGSFVLLGTVKTIKDDRDRLSLNF